MEKIYPDPVAWAKEYIEQLNQKEKDEQLAITVKFLPSEQIQKEDQSLLEGGYLFLQKIYYELRLDYICKKISEKYRFEYDLNEILSRLIYYRRRI